MSAGEPILPTLTNSVRQQSRAVDDRENQNLIVSKVIDRSIVVNDPFADVVVIPFWDTATDFGELCKVVRRGDDFGYDRGSISFRIKRNVIRDCVKLLVSLGMPTYLMSHLSRRFLTSSCRIAV